MCMRRFVSGGDAWVVGIEAAVTADERRLTRRTNCLTLLLVFGRIGVAAESLVFNIVKVSDGVVELYRKG